MHSPHTLTTPVLHDGCRECEQRGESTYAAITAMDPQTFERAWQRAATMQLAGLPDVQECELVTLRALVAVQLQLERRGFVYGELPTAASL